MQGIVCLYSEEQAAGHPFGSTKHQPHHHHHIEPGTVHIIASSSIHMTKMSRSDMMVPSKPQDIPNQQKQQQQQQHPLLAQVPALGRAHYDRIPQSSRPSNLVINPSSLNENGSFEVDRVVKSGMVGKRTRKTKVVIHQHAGRKPYHHHDTY